MRKVIDYLRLLGFEGKHGDIFSKRLDVLTMKVYFNEEEIVFMLESENMTFFQTLQFSDITQSLNPLKRVDIVFGRLIEKYSKHVYKSLYNGKNND